MKIPIKRLDPELPLPARAHGGDAGLDLRAREPGRLDPGERRVVPTGVAVAIPEGHVGMVMPRSGLAVDHGISVVNSPGIVDSGYRGEIKVVLVNLGAEGWTYERGDRIGQLLVVPCESLVVEEADDLPPSERGAGGFGSSGV